MTKESNPRKPRKDVPTDVASCPPALNLSKASVRKTKFFIDELVAKSVSLPGIEEKSEETNADDSTSVVSARFQSEISSLATNDAPSAYKGSAFPKPKTKNVVEKSIQTQRPFKSSINRKAPQPWPLSGSGQELPPSRPKDRSRRLDTNDGTGVRPPARQHRQQDDVDRNPSARPNTGRNQGRKSAFSSVRSSMNSSMVSWDTMSYSVYSIYTTASTIARRPAWGHYVVGCMVFVGWMWHHWYFSEYFVPSTYATRGMDTSAKALTYGHYGHHSANLLPLADDVKPSMLRGAVRDTAIYRTQDIENRNDFEPIRPAASAFDVIEGEPSDRDEIEPATESLDGRGDENDEKLSDSTQKKSESILDAPASEEPQSSTAAATSKEGETP